MIYRILTILFLLCGLMLAGLMTATALYAQIPQVNNDEPTTSTERSLAKHDYASASIENIAKLYWALDKLDIENDEHLDNYIRITECEIFSNYRNNEFEWAEIRNAVREGIKAGKGNFPLRFEIVLPIQLDRYDQDKEAFEIVETHQMEEVGRLEMISESFGGKVCGYVRDIPHFPQGLILDISKPFTLTHVPMDKDEAREYVEGINKRFKQLPAYAQTGETMDSMREVTLVLNVKIYLYNDTVKMTDARERALVAAVLEGYDIYRSPARENLTFSEVMLRRKKIEGLELELIKEYQALRLKRGEITEADIKEQ